MVNYQEITKTDGSISAVRLRDDATCSDRVSLGTLTDAVLATQVASLPDPGSGFHWVLNECLTGGGDPIANLGWTVGPLQGQFIVMVRAPDPANQLNVVLDHFDSVRGWVYYRITNNPAPQPGKTWIVHALGRWMSIAQFNACPCLPRRPINVELFLVDTSLPEYQWRSNITPHYRTLVNYI